MGPRSESSIDVPGSQYSRAALDRVGIVGVMKPDVAAQSRMSPTLFFGLAGQGLPNSEGCGTPDSPFSTERTISTRFTERIEA